MKDIFSESEIKELLKPYSQLKQLEIRNTRNGSIWQVYHIQNEFERRWLSEVSRKNGFMGQEVNEDLTHPETWIDWRTYGAWQPILDMLKPNTKIYMPI